MFEDINSSKKSVEDIFAETEAKTFTPTPPVRLGVDVPPPPPMPPVYAPTPTMPQGVMMPGAAGGSGVTKWIVIILVAVLVVGGGAWAAYQYWYLPSIAEPAPVNNDNINNVNTQPENNEQPSVNEEQLPPPPPTGGDVDGDSDNLTDSYEYSIGTDPVNSDSDYDGLFDGEEINLWHTNPLSPDTDGDGYFDGLEVQGGYNPNGEGRLLELPNGELNLQEIDNIIKNIDGQPS